MNHEKKENEKHVVMRPILVENHIAQDEITKTSRFQNLKTAEPRTP